MVVNPETLITLLIGHRESTNPVIVDIVISAKIQIILILQHLIKRMMFLIIILVVEVILALVIALSFLY